MHLVRHRLRFNQFSALRATPTCQETVTASYSCCLIKTRFRGKSKGEDLHRVQGTGRENAAGWQYLLT